MNDRLKTTLTAWPAITAGAIATCYLTKVAAACMGIKLPDQDQIELVRQYIGLNKVFVQLVVQIVAIIPAIEEAIFRFGLFKLPARFFKQRIPIAIASSAIFSFAHYIDYVKLLKYHPFELLGWNDAFLALFLFGLAQCWLYSKTDRIWCPILNHALFNITNLVILIVVSLFE